MGRVASDNTISIIHKSLEIIMEKSFTTLIGIAFLGASLSAIAGPDWQVIEQARKDAHAHPAIAEATTVKEQCGQKRLVLPLDHGPRAQTTPALNRQRQAAFEAEMKACREAEGKNG